MAIVSEYPAGAPCWFELATTDQSAAKQFYTQLFGWSVFDAPMGPGEVYTMFKKGDRDVGGGFRLTPEMAGAGVPPHWMVYFSAPKADETAGRVNELGGAVIKPPFDVMDVGRMAVCKDPTNAVFSLWESKAHKGAGVFGEDNAVCWVELATRDAVKAREFYTRLFGWETTGSANMPTYIEYTVGGQPRGGILPMDNQWPEQIPAQWGIYFMVADCDATTAKAKELGATVRHGPFSAPGVGRMAMLADPQGAGFSLMKLDPQP